MNDFHQLDDFVLFLFLHVASVDGSIHPNETETIHEKMTELFPGYPSEEKFAGLLSEYRKLGTVAAEDLLRLGWPSFTSTDPAVKAKIYADLFDIINSDARVNEEETRVLKIFKPWLTS